MRALLLVVAVSLVALGACTGKDAAHQAPERTVVVGNVAADGDPQRPAGDAPASDTPASLSRCPDAPVFAAGVNRDGAYLATFDGKPAGPVPACGISDWDIQVHSRNADTWQELEAMDAQHGPDCSPPPATHHTSSYESAVFLCRDHIMTSINAGGYGVIYLTPNQALDLRNGEAVFRFDVSTRASSTRDWWDVWITPFDDNLALPLQSWLPDLQGEPRNALHVRNLDGDGAVCAQLFLEGEERLGDNFSSGCEWGTPIRDLLQPSPTVRTPFEIRLSRTHVKVCMVNPQFCWMDREIPQLSWDFATVQIGHHSYSPDKDERLAGQPNTWHWDNVSLSPAREFTMLKADVRSVDEDGEAVTFAAPAPEDASLRFSAVGQVEINDGAGWRQVTPQKPKEHVEHLSSYFVPIPAGTTRVAFRFSKDDWLEGPFLARDFSIWAPPR